MLRKRLRGLQYCRKRSFSTLTQLDDKSKYSAARLEVIQRVHYSGPIRAAQTAKQRVIGDPATSPYQAAEASMIAAACGISADVARKTMKSFYIWGDHAG
jgi:hypothetical protein